MYDPRVGVWLSEDPIGLAAADWNDARYDRNDATGGCDPSGLRPWMLYDNLEGESFWHRAATQSQFVFIDPELRAKNAADRAKRIANRKDLTIILIAGHETEPGERTKFWEPQAITAFWQSQIWTEVNNTEDMIFVLNTLPDGSVKRLVIGGHGSDVGVRLGPLALKIQAGSAEDASAFTLARVISDEKLRKMLRLKLIAGASVELQGCQSDNDQKDLDLFATLLQSNLWITCSGIRYWNDETETKWKRGTPQPEGKLEEMLNDYWKRHKK
jgi:hypothetical protein